MTLAPGTRLGPYEITAQIGVGGMGEVYRATDTNLKRQVAIKILPESVAGDAERLARFQREAEVLAALNHPNIAQIYGLEKGSGPTALVMELVEGPTLAEHLANPKFQSPNPRSQTPRGLPVDEAVAIATQIAEALEAAHEQGIIHRDLKPANIKVRPDGTVKVLDFGLAKAMEPAAAMAPGVSQSPTITTPAMTQMGVILGTAAYMSPEQARGKPVDKRTDIWAFGCVLYEMLTGRRAFGGEDVSLTLSEVLQRDPDFGALPALPAVPALFLRQCFKKDPKARVQAIGDVRAALDGAFDADAAGVGIRSHGVARARWPTPLVLAAAVGLTTMAGAGFMFTRSGAEPPSTQRLALVLTTDGVEPVLRGGPGDLSLDAEGQILVFSGRDGTSGVSGARQLFVRRIDAQNAVPIRGTEGVVGAAAVSPDGAWVAFVAGQRLQKVAVGGGAPVPLLDVPDGHVGIAWLGATAVIIGTRLGLLRVPAEGGGGELVTRVDVEAGEGDHRWPAVSADGRVLAYTAWAGAFTTARIRVRALDSGRDQVLVQGSYPWLTSTGHLVFTRGGTLWAAAFDPETLASRTEAVPVLDAVNSGVNGQGDFALSRSGLLVYGRRLERGTPLRILDRDGRVVALVGEEFQGINHERPRYSPNGALVAVTRHPTGRDDEVVIHDLVRGGMRPLAGGGNSRYPVWNPSAADRLVFATTRHGSFDIFEMNLSDGRLAPLVVRPEDQMPTSWTPDGQVLAFDQVPPGLQVREASDIWLLRRGSEPAPLLADPAVPEFGAVFSPAGRRVAFVSGDSGLLEVYVQAYPLSGSRLRVSTGGGINPVWSLGGDGIYYQGADAAQIWYVPLAAAGGESPGRAQLVWTINVSPTNRYGSFDLSPDGQRVVVVDENVRPSDSLEVITNWLAELQRLVPAP